MFHISLQYLLKFVSSKYLASYAFDAGLIIKCPLLLSGFNEHWNVLANISKTPDTNFVVIHRSVFELCTDRLTHQSI